MMILSPGPGMDVDTAFDIDATIDASAGADPSIAGTVGKENSRALHDGEQRIFK